MTSTARRPRARSKWLSALIAALGLAAPSAAQAGDCLDQAYLPNPQTNGLEVTSSQPVTQTFTVGMAGLLTRVEIANINHHRGTPSQPLQVDLVTVDAAGVPTATALASFTLQPAQVPATRGAVQLDLVPFTIPVTPGQQYGIALSSNAAPSTQTYAWWGEAPGGAYAGGQVFIQQTTALSAWDVSFRTWVSAPAAWLNYGAGHPGANGVPALTASALPVIGTTPDIQIGSSANATVFGVLVAGFGRDNAPTPVGGTSLVQFVATFGLTVPTGGAPFPLAIPNDPSYCGVIVDFQSALFDPGAAQGVALSAGLELVIGG